MGKFIPRTPGARKVLRTSSSILSRKFLLKSSELDTPGFMSPWNRIWWQIPVLDTWGRNEHQERYLRSFSEYFTANSPTLRTRGFFFESLISNVIPYWLPKQRRIRKAPETASPRVPKSLFKNHLEFISRWFFESLTPNSWANWAQLRENDWKMARRDFDVTGLLLTIVKQRKNCARRTMVGIEMRKKT